MKSSFWKLVRFAAMLGLAVWAMESRAVAQMVAIPDMGLRDAIRTALGKPTGDITVADMESLTILDASRTARGSSAPLIGSLEGLQMARNLTYLDMSAYGWRTPPSLGTGNLSVLADLTNLTMLDLSWNGLTSLTLPTGLTGLTTLGVGGNQLTNLTLPAGLNNLTLLNLSQNQLTSLILPASLTSLTTLYLNDNRLTSLSLPAGLTNLTTLELYHNQLISFPLPAGLTCLTKLDLSGNQLTNLTMPAGLTNLTTLELYNNQLTSLTLPAGLTSLNSLDLWGNPLISLTLPAGLTSLFWLDLVGIPLATLVLPELTAPSLFPSIEDLRRKGVAVYVYPLETRLVAEFPTVAGAFGFTFAGPPGPYRVQVTSDFSTWTELDSFTNQLGSGMFTDSSAGQRPQNFYRVKGEP